MRGQPPQGRQIHYVTPCIAGPGQPGLDAAGRAEQPLVAAGVHHVVPHVRGRDHEVRKRLQVGRVDLVGAGLAAGQPAGMPVDMRAGLGYHQSARSATTTQRSRGDTMRVHYRPQLVAATFALAITVSTIASQSAQAAPSRPQHDQPNARHAAAVTPAYRDYLAPGPSAGSNQCAKSLSQRVGNWYCPAGGPHVGPKVNEYGGYHQ